MTKQEAFEELSKGGKVSHRYFLDDEFIYLDERGNLLDERGNIMGTDFWELRESEAWEIDWFLRS